MTSNENDGGDENNFRSTSSDHPRHGVYHDDNVDDPARDFVPPRNYVRKRQLPIYHSPLSYSTGGNREVEDEGLAAYKAVSDQLSRGTTRQRTGGQEVKNGKPFNHKSSASSISSVGGNSILNDGFSSDLIRGPVGSFAEDSPIRDRDSPNASYRAAYAMELSPPYNSSDQHRTQAQDLDKTTDKLFAKWSTRISDSNASFGYPPADGLKLSPTSKPVTTDWNELFPNYGDTTFPSPAITNRTSPRKVTMPLSKKLSMQDVFRSPPTHDLKKRHQLLSSPSFSFGGIETPGAGSNGFSPVPAYPSDDEYGNDARKFNKLRFHSSFDDDHGNVDDDQLKFIPTFPPTSISALPKDELEGVRRSPLLSSERKSSSGSKSPSILSFKDDPEIKNTSGKKPKIPSSKSSKNKTPKKSGANPRTPWTDANVDTGNIRRVTMGEPQSSRSLADINSMMRRGQSNVKPSTKTPPKPKSPVKKKPPPGSHDTTTKQAKSPDRSASILASTQSKVSEKKDSVQEQRQVGEIDRSTKTEVLKTSERSNEYLYPYLHNSAIPHHYGTYPTLAVPPFHHEYHSHNSGGRSHHVLAPVHYPTPQTSDLSIHFAQPPSSSPHIPPRYDDRRTSPAMSSTYALPATPRYQHGYGVQTQSGPTSMYSVSRTHMPGPAPPYGWPITSSAVSSRYSSPSLHHSSLSRPSSSRPTPVRPIGHLNQDKENSANKSVGATPKSKRSPCNCKKSRCLKLYCECFSAQLYCEECNCTDCFNTEGHAEIREKTMKELLHKNKSAFDVKTPGTITIGCKCKRSECLKKYCECFQAGTVCVDQCKCVSCSNRAGSQKLIDKRRKMKDTKGAEYAMQISREVWEHQPRVASVTSKPPLLTSKDVATKRPVVQHYEAALDKLSRLHSTKPARLGQPAIGNVGFSPMETNVEGVGKSKVEQVDDKVGIDHPMTTPTVTTAIPPASNTNEHPSALMPANVVSVITSDNKSGTTIEHPETPAGVRRLSFDSTATGSVTKKQKQCIDDTMAVHFFGSEFPPLPSSMMATIFQFLPESEILQTSQVSKLWKSLQNP